MINPTDQQMQDFLETDQDSPVIFLNCHRYHAQARYADDFDDDRYPPNVSGREAYHRYLQQVATQFVPRVGGRLLLAGPSEMTLIGEGGWDEVVMGQYPSKGAAMSIPTMPGYADIAVHREAGLGICPDPGFESAGFRVQRGELTTGADSVRQVQKYFALTLVMTMFPQEDALPGAQRQVAVFNRHAQ